MADNQQGQEQQPQFALQRIYVKDLSLESPKSPRVFKSQWQPEVKLDLSASNSQLEEEGLYEVVLSLTVTATNGGETAFMVEVEQAGIFLIRNMEPEQLHHTLGAFCPNILFPYARETIDNLANRGSFPALMLSPVNFDALYAQTLKQVQQEAAAESLQ